MTGACLPGDMKRQDLWAALHRLRCALHMGPSLRAEFAVSKVGTQVIACFHGCTVGLHSLAWSGMACASEPWALKLANQGTQGGAAKLMSSELLASQLLRSETVLDTQLRSYQQSCRHRLRAEGTWQAWQGPDPAHAPLARRRGGSLGWACAGC